MIPQRATSAGALVVAASPDPIRSRLREVAKRARRYKRWLNNDHPYNGDVIGILNQQRNVDAAKLGEYIACSAPLHLADGWNYLSRAFDAVSGGDRSSAYHLAYYAELRATMSLLASEGIGVFNNRHIALNAHLEVTEFGSSTHQATWLLLNAWANETGRAARLLEAITIESKSLANWLERVGVVEPTRRLVAKKWLGAWSVDLKILATDRNRRNDMSYRPTRIRVPGGPPVNPRLELANPILDAWSELGPTIGGVSAALDLSLLREALRLVVNEGVCNYETLGKALESLKDVMAPVTYQALKYQSASAATIFRDAGTNNLRGKAATPILARGLLMLRLASASTASLLKAAELSKSDLEFWWSPLGTDLGLWENAADIETFADLWMDVGEAKNEVDARIAAMQGDGSVRSFANILARDVSLTQFSRAPMWLLELD